MKDYEQKHADFLRKNGAECTVLLKSDGSFPLEAPCALALYGSGARNTVKGGTGSGEVNSRYFVTAEEGLLAAGFRITTQDWLDRYGALYPVEKKRFIRKLKRAALRRGTLAVLSDMGAVMPEPEYAFPTDQAGDAAVYVLSRISGEGSDRKTVPGDILLSETEKRDILVLNQRFEKFLLVLNVGGVVDLSPVSEVRNILLMSQLGMESGNILSDILLGKSTPSGKLTTSWSAAGDYPAIGSFGERDDTRYREGIYVGYRYFDSVGKKALFPFGYGLSYTSFDVKQGALSVEGSLVTARVLVKNTGAFPGKEVVQLYVSSPAGRLDKPYQTLAAFAKTPELLPGEETEMQLSFDLGNLSSYETARAAWILESGDYVLRIGTSSRDTVEAGIVRLSGESVVKQLKNLLGTPDFTDWKPEENAGAELGEAVAGCPGAASWELPVFPLDAALIRTETANYALHHDLDPEVRALSDDELCLLSIGAFKKSGAVSVVGNAANTVAGAAGESRALPGKGIPGMVMADGPAGVRLSPAYTVDEKGAHALNGSMPASVLEMMPAPAAFVMKLLDRSGKAQGKVYEQHCSALPIGTALAQSWNLDFAEACGDLIGDEMARFKVHLWLAPALNVHRDIRCGRNYEYFSEDPLISGAFAAALTRGVQRHPGRGVTLKHFAANNQETSRYVNNSRVSERALREIYLRGFEIAVRESDPHAIMTSYNLINGVHTAERWDLLEEVLRAEFGFRGIVMTDWIIAVMASGSQKYKAPNAAKVAAAGNDILMPGAKHDYRALKKGFRKGLVTREQLEINATRIIRMAKALTAE